MKNCKYEKNINAVNDINNNIQQGNILENIGKNINQENADININNENEDKNNIYKKKMKVIKIKMNN